MNKEFFIKNKNKILIGVLVAVILIAGVVLAVKVMSKKPDEQIQPTQDEEQQEEIVQRNENVKIFSGTQRPLAVMIDNHSGAWPQAGLNKAYMVYEIIVEGGETRLMALFKGVDVDKVGPVRSCRHYFLDYALENDAIYTHYGWSPQGKKDITKLGVNNINGITEGAGTFRRVSDKKAPHNAVTSTANLYKSAESKGYRTTSNAKSVLKYAENSIELENGKLAKKVTIPHSNLQTVTYTYDEQAKTYKRAARGKAQTDWDSGANVTTKNIIIEFIDNYDLNDGSGKGRQGLYNIGTFDGYYITNGKAIKITCTKSDRNKKTIYKDANGNEIEVNDGNTWVNICPKGAQVKFE